MTWVVRTRSVYCRRRRDTLIPWQREIPSGVQELALCCLAVALDEYGKGTARFPPFNRMFGLDAGLVSFSVKDHKTTWRADGGRTVHLPFAAGTGARGVAVAGPSS
jgi:hypothetical protein